MCLLQSRFLWIVSSLASTCAATASLFHEPHFTRDNSTDDGHSHLGQIKLGLAAAFFFGVIVACGLPIILINCLERKAEIVEDLDGPPTTDNHFDRTIPVPSEQSALPNTENGPVARVSLDTDPFAQSQMTITETTDLLTGRPISSAWPLVRRERMANVEEARSKRMAKPVLPLTNGVSVKRSHSTVDRKRLLHLWFSRFNCAAAGIFLSSGFMELYIDVEEVIDEAKDRLNIVSHFPFAPFLTLIGFFLVLSIEQIVWTVRSRRLRVLAQQRRPSTATTTTPLSPPSASHHTRFSFSTDRPPGPTGSHSHGHSHLPGSEDQFDSFESVLRVVVLLCAMSVHSLFEGLAVGLQSTVTQTLGLFSAVLLHKFIIAVGIGMNLATVVMPPEPQDDADEEGVSLEGIRTPPIPTSRKVFLYQAMSTFTLAIASPIGVLIGWALMQQKQSPVLLMTTAVLQGLACGTFFYVVFCELLPEEFRGPVGDRLGKLTFLILGFLFVCVYSIYVPH